jgi:hypothetical protein
MTQQSTPTAPAVRHDGWTSARRAQFLEALSHNGNVLAACARVGMSREAAYRLRRREPAFARAWAAAQMVGREASAEMLGCRAIDGVEEEVWYRGELRGTRRRFDSRLLLAHVARLDKLAEANEEAVADAERFDELVALACGAEAPEELAMMDGLLPGKREYCAAAAADAAADGWSAADEMPTPEPIDDEDPEARAVQEIEAWRAAQDQRSRSAAKRASRLPRSGRPGSPEPARRSTACSPSRSRRQTLAMRSPEPRQSCQLRLPRPPTRRRPSGIARPRPPCQVCQLRRWPPLSSGRERGGEWGQILPELARGGGPPAAGWWWRGPPPARPRRRRRHGGQVRGGDAGGSVKGVLRDGSSTGSVPPQDERLWKCPAHPE